MDVFTFEWNCLECIKPLPWRSINRSLLLWKSTVLCLMVQGCGFWFVSVSLVWLKKSEDSRYYGGRWITRKCVYIKSKTITDYVQKISFVSPIKIKIPFFANIAYSIVYAFFLMKYHGNYNNSRSKSPESEDSGPDLTCGCCTVSKVFNNPIHLPCTRGVASLLVCTLFFLCLMGRAPQTTCARHFLPAGVEHMPWSFCTVFFSAVWSLKVLSKMKGKVKYLKQVF